MATATARAATVTKASAPTAESVQGARKPAKPGKPAGPDLATVKLTKGAETIRDRVIDAVSAIEGGHAALLAAIYSASVKREQVQAAVYQAYAKRGNEHRTCQIRASEAGSVFDQRAKLKELGDEGPKSLQMAVKAARNLAKGLAWDAKPTPKKRQPDTAPKGGSKGAGSSEAAEPAPSAEVAPIGLEAAKQALVGTINGLKKRAADEATAELLAELLDVLNA